MHATLCPAASRHSYDVTSLPTRRYALFKMTREISAVLRVPAPRSHGSGASPEVPLRHDVFKQPIHPSRLARSSIRCRYLPCGAVRDQIPRDYI